MIWILSCVHHFILVHSDGEIINQIKGTNAVLDEIKELLKQQVSPPDLHHFITTYILHIHPSTESWLFGTSLNDDIIMFKFKSL